jgi:NAD(P)-dependent dehydrogenase (short-subunit alcohol dehydrogenase family)
MAASNYVVTGAAGVLGRAVCAQLAKGGSRVAAIGHGAADVLPDSAEVRLGGVDLTDETATTAAFATAAEQLGSLDGLVNAAGGFAWETVAEGSIETWDRLYAINLKTALNACRAVLPWLAEGGSIVNVGAASAGRAERGMAAYAASKSAVARLTEGLAVELKARRIRVNAVLPSIIDTAANRAAMPDADFSKWVTTGELAEAIAFLLSDAASGVTGALIPVTGRV